MKKIIFLYILCCLNISSYAQKRLYIGTLLGGKEDKVELNDDGGAYLDKQAPRLIAGVQANLYFNRNYSLEFGVNSNSVGANATLYLGSGAYRLFSDNGNTMLQIPIRLQRRLFSFFKQKRWELNALAGVSYFNNWNVGLDYVGPDIEPENPNNFINSEFSGKRAHNFSIDYGLQLACVRKHFRFYTSYFWNYGLGEFVRTEGSYAFPDYKNG
ncbi:MAG: hypothetical protein NW226_27185 [Microscillaceae bacterium]|nr:hypothetical protein [Microscillaceae bacterium]